MNEQYKAVIFDLNGVIIDDESLHERAFKEVIGECGVRLSHDDYIRCFAGRTDEAGVVEYQEHLGGRSLGNTYKIVQWKQAVYQNLFQNEALAYPYVSKTIEAVARSGMKLAVVTGAPRREADAVFNKLSIKVTFDAIISSEDVAMGKPHPEGYLLAAETLNVTPEECIVIEDSPSGIDAAKKAGMFCIAVTNTHSESALHAADSIVSDIRYDELRDILRHRDVGTLEG